MNACLSRMLPQLVVRYRSRFLGIRTSVITALAFIVLSLPSSVVAASPPPIPPGYSSEVIYVKFRAGIDIQTPAAALPSALQNAVPYIDRLFSLPEQKIHAMKALGESRLGQTLPDLHMWVQIILRPGTDAATFLEELKQLDSVEVAEPAPLPAPPPAITPDFTGNQGYLNTAPDGIEARYAWTLAGGNGSGVTIYDVEYSWHQTHEDLSKVEGVSLLLDTGDTAFDPFHDENHGTAVLGELIADNDTIGVTGIAWGANIGLAPALTVVLGYNPANAIMLAVAHGSPGDVILIEQQICVCNLSCSNSSQQGLGPLEWSTPVFNAIQFAVAHGFVVVEAAGNGSVNLDQAACGTRFNRNVRDSGAIVVGAGGSPGSGADRQRLSFSSYGSRIDVQGQGDRVTTTGYGDLYGAAANITSPTQGSTFTSASVTFTWDTGTGVTQYWLYVGRTVGGADLYNQPQDTSRSVTVNGLPTNGSTVYVRLWSLIGSTWIFKDYIYYRAVDANFWYTGTFGGTSSASPIVAGAAANLNGIALQQHRAPLPPSQMRQLLVQTGSPQLGNTAEHIGPRVNLRQAIAQMAGAATDHLARTGLDADEQQAFR